MALTAYLALSPAIGFFATVACGVKGRSGHFIASPQA
jgi:hypothetical protein